MRLAHHHITALSIAGAALLAGCSTNVRSGEDLDTNTVEQSVAPEEAGDAPEEAGDAPEEAGDAPEEACSTDLLFDGVTCPDDCTSGVLGDGVTCQDPNALIEQGIPICEEIGLVLRDLQIDKADYAVCDEKVLQATYLCCPAWEASEEPLPPPEPPCEATGVVGDGTGATGPARAPGPA
ncbi:hypothetical protein WME99_23865 [Sorangium sp. So ce136]|uniref:hypothetical protein n=1 Tax=Sorangium sp. So ce136 TaxID=3133284 RepID=UPI003F047097